MTRYLVPGGKASLWDMPLVVANRMSDRRGENRLMQKLVNAAPYLSPERARGEGASPAGDVYSLGAIACVSAGAPLPTAATTLGVVHLVAAALWVPRVPSSLPRHWASILERMLAVDPASRPSAAEVALAFAKVPGQHALPTVPELAAVRLPPGILAAAGALMKAQAEARCSVGGHLPPVSPEASAAPIPTSVALNESLSVSPELLADSAMTLSSEEVAAVRSGSRQVWRWVARWASWSASSRWRLSSTRAGARSCFPAGGPVAPVAFVPVPVPAASVARHGRPTAVSVEAGHTKPAPRRAPAQAAPAPDSR